MINHGLFRGTLSILSKALDFRAYRHRITVTNIANLTTPGYKAKEIRFEEALNQGIRKINPPGLIKTHPRHFLAKEVDWDDPRVEVILSDDAKEGADGNTVDEDFEMEKLAENQLMYFALVRVLSRKLMGIKKAIKEGGR